jgi:hypothetical protein
LSHFNEAEVEGCGFKMAFFITKNYKMKWVDVKNYEGRYKISNTGILVSIKNGKQKQLKGSISNKGYVQYTLSCRQRNQYNVYTAQQLVAMGFLNHEPCGLKLVIDHINDNPLDNRLENLQIVSNRFNSCKTQGRYSSKYKGVSKTSNGKRWRAGLTINNKSIYLGSFDCEVEAHKAYLNAVKKIEDERMD